MQVRRARTASRSTPHRREADERRTHLTNPISSAIAIDGASSDQNDAAIMTPAANPSAASSSRRSTFSKRNTTAAPAAVMPHVKSVATNACATGSERRTILHHAGTVSRNRAARARRVGEQACAPFDTVRVQPIARLAGSEMTVTNKPGSPVPSPEASAPTSFASPGDTCPEVETFVQIPAGWFQMGSDDGPEDERPVHRVWVDAFELRGVPRHLPCLRAVPARQRPRTAARLAALLHRSPIVPSSA